MPRSFAAPRTRSHWRKKRYWRYAWKEISASSSPEARSQSVPVPEAQVAVPRRPGPSREARLRARRRASSPRATPSGPAPRGTRRARRAPALRRAPRSGPRTGGGSAPSSGSRHRNPPAPSGSVGRSSKAATGRKPSRSRSSGEISSGLPANAEAPPYGEPPPPRIVSGRTCQRVWPADFAQSRKRSDPRTEVADAERPGKRRGVKEDSGGAGFRRCHEAGV